MTTKLVQLFEQRQVQKLSEGKTIPDIRPGCVVKIMGKTKEGNTERFEGLCIKRRNLGLATNITLRKLSANNEYVEKTFNVFSPRIDTITIVKRGKVRRAKLYYMRELVGKAARIKEISDYEKYENSELKVYQNEIVIDTPSTTKVEDAKTEKAEPVKAESTEVKAETKVEAKEEKTEAKAEAKEEKK